MLAARELAGRRTHVGSCEIFTGEAASASLCSGLTMTLECRKLVHDSSFYRSLSHPGKLRIRTFGHKTPDFHKPRHGLSSRPCNAPGGPDRAPRPDWRRHPGPRRICRAVYRGEGTRKASPSTEQTPRHAFGRQLCPKTRHSFWRPLQRARQPNARAHPNAE